MTERAGGSDVGAIETVARHEDGEWRLHGDKWFCSHADADVALMLARARGRAGRYRRAGVVCPAAASEGRQPQQLPHRAAEGQAGHAIDGERRDPAAGRGRLSRWRCQSRPQADDGAGQPVAAVAWGARGGDDAALRQRSASVRADPLGVRQDHHRLSPAPPSIAEDHRAGRTGAVDVPVRGGCDGSRQCRIEGSREPVAHPDAAFEIPGPAATTSRSRPVRWRCAAAMAISRNGSMRGWCATPISACSGKAPATSTRLISSPARSAKAAPHEALQAALTKLLHDATALPAAFRDRLRQTLDRTIGFAERVAAEPALEENARAAASALYHITSAILMSWESGQPGADARRALHARSILDHRLSTQDPLAPQDGEWEHAAADILCRIEALRSSTSPDCSQASRWRAVPVRIRDRPGAGHRASASVFAAVRPMASPWTRTVERLGAISRPISRSPRPMIATGCSDPGPSRNRPAARRPAMKPMACASLAANNRIDAGQIRQAPPHCPRHCDPGSGGAAF